MAKAKKSTKRKFVGRKRVSGSRQFKPKSEFLQFFEQVVGKPASPNEARIARQHIQQFKADLENPKISLERCRQVWDGISQHWQKLISPIRLNAEIKMLRRHALLQKNDRVASFGSGPAIIEAFLAKNIVPAGFVSCIDLSLEMNKHATQIKERAGVKNMRIITCSATKTELPSSSQNKVIIGQTDLAGTIHWKGVLKEAFRIIKKVPTSKLIISFSPENQKDIQALLKSLRDNGFRVDISAIYAQKEKHKAVIVFSDLQSKFWGNKN